LLRHTRQRFKCALKVYTNTVCFIHLCHTHNGDTPLNDSGLELSGVEVCTLSMETSPLRITLGTLRSEREGTERRAVESRDELESVGQRSTHLRGAIEGIEALLGLPSEDDEAVLADDDEAPEQATPREVDFTNLPDNEPLARKRVPSTDWVAEVVGRIGRPADRDEIYKAFHHHKGFPEAWTNPRNSVNNALGRAVERGMVRRLEENLFAPMGYNPAGSNNQIEGS
jgi:hypothetical protein